MPLYPTVPKTITAGRKTPSTLLRSFEALQREGKIIHSEAELRT